MRKVPSIRELKEICLPPEVIARGSWCTPVIRPISLYVTKCFLYTPITANQITILMLIAGVAAGTLFTFGNHWCSIAGALLLICSLLLDNVDGEVARYRKASSLLGIYLDRLTHHIVCPYIFIGISFGVYANFHDIRVFIFGFSASLFFLLMLLAKLEKTNVLHKAGNNVRKDEIISTPAEQIIERNIVGYSLLKRMGSKIIIPTDAYIMMIVILIGAIFSWFHVILIIYGILFPCEWLLKVALNIKYGFRG